MIKATNQKIPLKLEPLSQPFPMIPLMSALKEHEVFDSWLAARDFIQDLDLIAPQVIWVRVEHLSSLEKVLADSEIMTQQVSAVEAKRIATENKPIKGDVKIQIRMQSEEINKELVGKLKEQKLISHTKSGGNADDIYHWKDDRWYQDYILFAFNKEDVRQIETIVSEYYCTVIGIET